MDNNTAKLILGVYRANGQDAQDPFFKDALRQADNDPSLRQWLSEQQRFDAEFAAALYGITVPAEGKATTLATMGVHPARRQRWWLLALAASVALLLALWGGTKTRPSPTLQLPSTANLAELAAILSEHHASIGLMSPDYVRLREWLTKKGGPLPNRLPPGLAKMAVLGCQTWETSRGKVSLICFVSDQKKTVHLYIFENPRDGLPLPPMTSPRFAQSGQWSLALWKDDGCSYVLGLPTADGGKKAIEALFHT
ncbi:MAG: hypothetical protein KGJ37_02275 [Verrucomicrobiota bacterium]|nr:hypothetical protein [Verrucomicrobiota bacterium]